MPSPASPVVAGWELALRLREQRERKKIEVSAITSALGFTRNYWSAVENERKILSEENLVAALDLLEFDEDERPELLDLRLAAKERGWWTQYGTLLDGDLQRLIGLEAGAERIRYYESLLIPGMLQTEEYTRGIMEPDGTIRPVDVDQRVEVRVRRQERLTGEAPLRVVAVMSEAALRQQIGGPAVLRRQLEHLVRSIEGNRAGLEVRIIPFTAKACGLFGAATIHLLDFPGDRLPTVMFQETVTTRDITFDAVRVAEISNTYESALERTLSPQKSLEKIQQCIEELD
ncbi:helix-turn-helix domain-containing protein [Lentzea albida]|uniref:Helix-turn-helix domain-containing protein n=1 Tax=Lentzea albida TaxID=65499 RepID=A0A1H9IPN0_9PSEU|nr:Scr1 family TA system antitoxin-like transcriptional regulator [Lentzea albida]SEQ76469.1 Helix-turn-helix domain-containing protein [Lentzea albida]